MSAAASGLEAGEELWALVRETVGDGRLSVVMPFYRLAAAASGNLRLVADLFESHRVPVELVPVDDGSADGTDAEFERVAADWTYRFVSLKPVVCRLNGGKGAALKAGFAASTGEYVMLLDGDLDIQPQQTPWFFERMAKAGADVVVGSKRHPRSVVEYPWHRRIVSWCYFTLVRAFIGLPLTDTQTGMKLFRREVLGEALARMLVKTYAFDLELLAIARSRGAKIAEAPVVIRFGQKFGALSPKTVKSMAWDSLAVFYRLRVLRYYARAEAPKPPAGEPLVSVVVACPGPSWMLEECLLAMERQTWARWEAIVLPDGEVDPAFAAKFSDRVRFVATGKVRPAEKRNLGIRLAQGEVVAFIDDDAYPDQHWIEYALKYFGDDTVGAVGGPGVTPPGDGFLARVGGRVYENPLVSGSYRYRYKAGGVRRDVDDYPSCNLFVGKPLLDAIGGYRTDFWPGEDTLLCKDIVDRGKRIVYDPWVVVCHHRRPLLMPHLRQLGRYAFHRGYFVKRYPSNSLHLSYFIPSLFVLYLVLAAALAVVPTPSAMPVWLWSLWYGVMCGPLLVYLALLFLTTFTWRLPTWALTACGVFATHVTYGVRFIQGLCASRAPCEFIGQDHASSGRSHGAAD